MFFVKKNAICFKLLIIALFFFSQGSTYITALIRFLKLNYFTYIYLHFKVIITAFFVFSRWPLPIMLTTCCCFMFKSNFSDIELKSAVSCLSQNFNIIELKSDFIRVTNGGVLTLHLGWKIIANWKLRMSGNCNSVRRL
jgi:hypothetical protein